MAVLLLCVVKYDNYFISLNYLVKLFIKIEIKTNIIKCVSIFT